MGFRDEFVRAIDWMRSGFDDLLSSPLLFLAAVPFGGLFAFFCAGWVFMGFLASMSAMVLMRFVRTRSGMQNPSWKKQLSLSLWSWAFGVVGFIFVFVALRTLTPPDLPRLLADSHGITLLGHAVMFSTVLPGVLSVSFFLLAETFLARGSRSAYKAMSHAYRALSGNFIAFSCMWLSFLFMTFLEVLIVTGILRVMDDMVSPRVFFGIGVLVLIPMWGVTWMIALKSMEKAAESLLKRK